MDATKGATLDIFTYAPKDIRLLLLLAVRPSDLSNACKIDRMIRKYCRSTNFLLKYIEHWYNVQGEEKGYLEEIIFELRPKKMIEVCKYGLYSFCDESILRSYSNALEENDPDNNFRTMFSTALKDGYVDTLEDLSNVYDPFWVGAHYDSERDIVTFGSRVERGDQDIFEAISKGRYTQTFFEKAIARAEEYEDEGIGIVIFNAAKAGDKRYVEVLLKEKRIDPSFGKNRDAIVAAAKGGYEDIVKMLMDVSPLDVKKRAIKAAKKEGYEDIVDLLERDFEKRVDAPFKRKSSSPMEEAARRYAGKLGEYHREFAEFYAK